MTHGERDAKKRSGWRGVGRLITRRIVPVGLVSLALACCLFSVSSYWRYLTIDARKAGGGGRWYIFVDHSQGDLYAEVDRSPRSLASTESMERWTWSPASPTGGRAVQPWYEARQVSEGWSWRGYGVRLMKWGSDWTSYSVVARIPSGAITGVAAGVTTMWLGVLAARRWRRGRLGLCTNCAYDLAGLDRARPCPECGADRTGAKRVGIAAWALGWAACVWMGVARRKFSRGARALNSGELAILGEHFDGALLGRVRVADVERIDLPGAELAVRRLGRSAASVFASPAGIALGDLVVIARSEAVADDLQASDRRASVLFHEVVHVAQYRALGVRGFLTRYLGAWLANGRDYGTIPLEVQAYELQDRFDHGRLEAGEVERAVRDVRSLHAGLDG
jgi:hypothetical protein